MVHLLCSLTSLLALLGCITAQKSEGKGKSDGGDKGKAAKGKSAEPKGPPPLIEAVPLNLTISSGAWPDPKGVKLDAILDDDTLEYLEKNQKYSQALSNQIGPKTKAKFAAAGMCVKRFECETITNPYVGHPDKDLKATSPPKPLTVHDMKKLNKKIARRGGSIKLNHLLHKGMLRAGEIHGGKVIVRFTASGDIHEVSLAQARGMVNDAFKLIILAKKATIIRAVLTPADDQPPKLMSVCIMIKGAHAGQQDEFCRGHYKPKAAGDDSSAKSEHTKDDANASGASGGSADSDEKGASKSKASKKRRKRKSDDSGESKDDTKTGSDAKKSEDDQSDEKPSKSSRKALKKKKTSKEDGVSQKDHTYSSGFSKKEFVQKLLDTEQPTHSSKKGEKPDLETKKAKPKTKKAEESKEAHSETPVVKYEEHGHTDSADTEGDHGHKVSKRPGAKAAEQHGRIWVGHESNESDKKAKTKKKKSKAKKQAHKNKKGGSSESNKDESGETAANGDSEKSQESSDESSNKGESGGEASHGQGTGGEGESTSSRSSEKQHAGLDESSSQQPLALPNDHSMEKIWETQRSPSQEGLPGHAMADSQSHSQDGGEDELWSWIASQGDSPSMF